MPERERVSMKETNYPLYWSLKMYLNEPKYSTHFTSVNWCPIAQECFERIYTPRIYEISYNIRRNTASCSIIRRYMSYVYITRFFDKNIVLFVFHSIFKFRILF